MDTSDKVIEVQPLNEDARTVIGDMDFAGANLDVTVNALIGSMLVNGYLDDIRNSILVSVENGDAAKAESLQAQVSALISSAVGDGGFEASVLTQTVSSTSESAALAEQYGISEGKAELILKVCAADATLTAESLAPLSVNDISLIASSRGLSDSTVNQTGTASAKGYIGVDDAKTAAYAHAGVSASDVLYVETDFDSEHGVMVYEVEFYAGSVEYEYDINALTGEVVKYEQKNTGTSIPSGSASGDYIGEAAEIQRKTGIPVVAVSQGTLFGEDFEQSLRIIGEVCGVSERAEEVIAYINDSLAELKELASAVPEDEKPTVLPAAATFKGAHGIEGIRMNDPVMLSVDAKNVADDGSGVKSSVIIDKEQVIAWDPEYIFLDSGGVALVRQDYAERPDYYALLKAYNEGHIYQYPSSTAYYDNMEISLANCYFVGSVLYPEAFAGIDVEAKANEIFKFFLGAEDYLSVLESIDSGYCEVVLG